MKRQKGRVTEQRMANVQKSRTVEVRVGLSTPFYTLFRIFTDLRATASKYRESADSEENSDFLLLRQKDPFGELFSEIHFQSSSEFTFL